MSTRKIGILYGIAAYLLWGLLPMYWKLIDEVEADVVLAHRIIWSFVFMLLFIIFTKRAEAFLAECKRIWQHKKTLLTITAASLIISLNWLIFIWSVQHGFVVQASLGYYINPLVSVLFAVVFLKETLTKGQVVASILAGIGVVYLTFSYGVFPWISLALAVTFALYGLLKKIVNINSSFGLAIETLIVTPIACLYLLFAVGGSFGFLPSAMDSNLLLIAAGVATAVPLLLFGYSVLYIPLSMAGFLQYLAPTIMLCIGVFLYHEPFTVAHGITFTFIWVSLILYMMSSLKGRRKTEMR